jgi:hypothetical protein
MSKWLTNSGINSRGQSSAEFAITLVVLIALVAGLLCGVYVGFVQIWVKHSSYEAVVCLARGENQTRCREELETRVNETLLGRPLQNVQLLRFKRRAHVSFEVRIFNDWHTLEKRTLSLPLRESQYVFKK